MGVGVGVAVGAGVDVDVGVGVWVIVAVGVGEGVALGVGENMGVESRRQRKCGLGGFCWEQGNGNTLSRLCEVYHTYNHCNHQHYPCHEYRDRAARTRGCHRSSLLWASGSIFLCGFTAQLLARFDRAAIGGRETLFNAPGGTRTHNLLIRSQALCPLELPGHTTSCAFYSVYPRYFVANLVFPPLCPQKPVVGLLSNCCQKPRSLISHPKQKNPTRLAFSGRIVPSSPRC